MRDRSEDQMTLVLIRHGATRANGEHRYLGKTDEALSESGAGMLLSHKRRNRYPKVDHLFISPMKRCLETAGILYPGMPFAVIPEWQEMDFGRFEYRNYEELREDQAYQAWIDSGGISGFPGGESRKDFILRCKRGWERMWILLDQMNGNGGRRPVRAGAVVHGGTIMALLSEYGHREYFDCRVSNGGGYICRIEGWGSSAVIKEAEEI